MQKPVDLMLSEAKVCVCAQDPVDLIILKERVGVFVQKPVDPMYSEAKVCVRRILLF